MNGQAVEKARRRLSKAEELLAQIEQPQDNYDVFREIWADFLIAIGGVYAVLEQGSKASPQSRQWFGSKKRLRNEDPMLQYLHQARNAEEHGISAVTNLITGGITVLNDPGGRLVGAKMEGQNVRLDFETDGDSPIEIEVDQPVIRLVTVTDSRFGDSFSPPTSHLGNELTDNTPLNVARLGLAYVRGLVAEAESMAK